jgi:hypothetical protein
MCLMAKLMARSPFFVTIARIWKVYMSPIATGMLRNHDRSVGCPVIAAGHEHLLPVVTRLHVLLVPPTCLPL